MIVRVKPSFLHSRIQVLVYNHHPHRLEDMELRVWAAKIEQILSVNTRTYQDFSMLRFQGCNQMSCKKMINDCLISNLSCLVEKVLLQSR